MGSLKADLAICEEPISFTFLKSQVVNKGKVSLSDLVKSMRLVPDNSKEAQVLTAVSEIELARLEENESIKIEGSEVAKLIRKVKVLDEVVFHIPSYIEIHRYEFSKYLAWTLKETIKKKANVDQVDIAELHISKLKTTEHVFVTVDRVLRSDTFQYNLFQKRNANDAMKKVGFVRGKYILKKRVPIVGRSIQIGQAIGEVDFHYEMRDVTKVRDSFPSKEEILSSEMKRARYFGQIIRSGDIQPQKLIRRGDLVHVTVHGGNLDWKIEFNGVAKTNGILGETIQLINPSTKKTMSGVVVSHGKVEMTR